MSSPDKMPTTSAEARPVNTETTRYLARRALRAAGEKGEKVDVLLRQTQSGRIGWQALAACGEYDSEIFFLRKGESADRVKGICASCEVKEECLNEALTKGYEYGVWGGLTENQRRALRRHQARNSE
jgi:WhiB family redox-sensing transcriptional regulator